MVLRSYMMDDSHPITSTRKRMVTIRKTIEIEHPTIVMIVKALLSISWSSDINKDIS